MVVMPENMTSELHRVLPFLEPYLMIVTNEGIVQDQQSQLLARQRSGDKSEVISTVSNVSSRDHQPDEKNSKRNTQLRVIRLLGKLGGNNVKLIGETNLTAQGVGSTVGIAWDCSPRIKFPLPFQDAKPEIFLGNQIACRRWRSSEECKPNSQ